MQGWRDTSLAYFQLVAYLEEIYKQVLAFLDYNFVTSIRLNCARGVNG